MACIALKDEVEVYDQYIRGDVYGFIIEDLQGNNVDSCWGFYGWEAAAEQADNALCGLKADPPDTILTPREEEMFKRIVDLGAMLSQADQHMNDISPAEIAGIEAIRLGIIHTWKD